MIGVDFRVSEYVECRVQYIFQKVSSVAAPHIPASSRSDPDPDHHLSEIVDLGTFVAH